MNTQPALLVIDVQQLYCTPEAKLFIDDYEDVIANINQLIVEFHRRHLPIIYVKHSFLSDGSDSGRMWNFTGIVKPSGFIAGTPAVEYADSLMLVSERIEITKNRYSCFKGTTLKTMLESLRVDTVVVTGFMTNFCCETTTREAHDLDYYAFFISDATSCPKTVNGVSRKHIKEAVHATMGAGFAVVNSTDEYLHSFRQTF